MVAIGTEGSRCPRVCEGGREGRRTGIRGGSGEVEEIVVDRGESRSGGEGRCPEGWGRRGEGGGGEPSGLGKSLWKGRGGRWFTFPKPVEGPA